MIKQTKSFTLVELLVVVAIIALLISILLPTLGRAQEQARQVICMSNLSGIQKGWMIYAAENNAFPPILPDIPTPASPPWAAHRNGLRMGNECTEAELGGGAQQNLCLLVKIGSVPWKMFICPSSGNREADRGGAGRKFGLGETVGGEDKIYCDYGLQLPYAYGNVNPCPLTQHMDGEIVILGDRAPAGTFTNKLTKWSRNHPNDGESILYAAGNVRFSKDKRADDDRNTAGWGGNNIYTGDSWNTSDWENPTLIQNGTSNPGWGGHSGKDTVLYWWE
jgi:type II secretory pathway pseudopilin PulG